MKMYIFSSILTVCIAYPFSKSLLISSNEYFITYISPMIVDNSFIGGNGSGGENEAKAKLSF